VLAASTRYLRLALIILLALVAGGVLVATPGDPGAEAEAAVDPGTQELDLAAAGAGPPAPAVRIPGAGLAGPEPLPYLVPDVTELDDNGAPPVVVRGSGWGHSVGMSQYGAQAMAQAGHGYQQILGHYYQGVDVTAPPAETPDEIRVNLFTNRQVDDSHVVVQTSSRDGNRPTRSVSVDLGDGPVAVPFPQAWTITADAAAGELVLTDRDGTERARGAGPARVTYDHTDGNPTLLRLPQLMPERRRTRLAATYQWGTLEIARRGDSVQPVMVLPLDVYLRGLAEMPSGWHVEALKAQAIAGRTYAVRQILGGLKDTCGCHLGATPHHQVYAGWTKEGGPLGANWVRAVNATIGEVATYQGELAWTYYSSSHGGRSEAANASWAYGAAIPYLRSVDDPWSHDPALRNPYAAWERTFSNAEFAAAIGGGLVEVTEVRIVDRTEGGTPRVLEVVGRNAGGDEIVRRYDGPGKGIAGSVLKLHFRSRLPSQQITAIEVQPAASPTP
jgi:SpoIID/LytB domain protein